MMKKIRFLAAMWGAAGVILFLSTGIYRVSTAMIPMFSVELSPLHWALLLANIIFMAYTEGYRGFQKGFAPRVAARVLFLSRRANWETGLLAPLFCMGYFGSSMRRQITSLCVTSGIILLVIVVKHLSQPWRGIVDAGVVVGLVWGVISLVVYLCIAFRHEEFPYSPEVSLRYAESNA